MTMTGTGPGQGVTGFIANEDNPFDPVKEGYPTGNPSTGFTAKNEGFAGVIYGTPAGGPANSLRLYCIDILTLTYGGIGYNLGTWEASNVPNVGYVARILNDYYPNTNEPASLTNTNQKAAAVQAAIWFFSDRYVLNTSDPVRDATVAIVDAVIAKGPLVQPPPPSLTITPQSVSGGRRGLGPFTVTTDHPPATVSATGATMSSDRAGQHPIDNPATVPSGQQIWLRRPPHSAPTSAVLQATSRATVPSGNVYLYAGQNPGVNDAQRLILAQDATLTTTVSATASFLPSGSLMVQKTIAGEAAGSQGQVTIHVACDDGVTRRDFIIPAGAPAATTSRTYRHIIAGTTCTVIETSNGSVTGTDVVVTGDGQQATIVAGEKKTVGITDTYTPVPSPTPTPAAGFVTVTKTIAGPLAGHQGPVTIQVVCNGVAQAPDFVISAGASAGSYSHTFGPVAAGAVCTTTETTDGATASVVAIVSGSGVNVTVPADAVAPVNVMDVYESAFSPLPDVASGSLRVSKVIGGPAAGKQGRIDILVACGNPSHTYAFVIPAHTSAGSVSRSFPDLPAGARCTVTEVANGHTSTVRAAGTAGGQTVTIRPGRAVSVHLTDTFSHKRRAPAPPFTG